MITSYIKKYIINKGEAGIFRLGTFRLTYKEAEVHPILHEFTPPGRYISFSYDESETGEDFARYLAAETNVGQAEAVDQISRWVDTLKKRLENDRIFEMGQMGKFVMGNVHMEFVPALDPELSPESFGLKSFTLRNESEETDMATVSGSPAEPPAVVTDAAPQPKPERHVIRTILYILLILLLLAIIAMGVFALLRPVQFVEKKDLFIEKFQSFFRSTSDTADLMPTEPEKEETEAGYSESQWQNKEDTMTAETTVSATEISGQPNCYIIIGGFGNAANADNLVRNLKPKFPDIANLGLNERGTLTMVGIGPYSREDAEKRVTELSSSYKDCWILEK